MSSIKEVTQSSLQKDNIIDTDNTKNSNNNNSINHDDMQQARKLATRGTIASILLKIFTFATNQLVLRSVNRKILGETSIQLDLLLRTSLFLGREGFRVALLRTSANSSSDCNNSNNSKGQQRATRKYHGNDKDLLKVSSARENVAWLTIPLGFILSIFALLFHLRRSSLSSTTSNDYRLAGCYYCLAAFIECISEPLVIRDLIALRTDRRLYAEGWASTLRSLVSVLLLSWCTRRRYNNVQTVSEGEVSSGRMVLLMRNLMKREALIIIPGPTSALGMAQCVYAIVTTLVSYRSHWGDICWPSFFPTSKSTNNAKNSQDNKSNSRHEKHIFDPQTLKDCTTHTFQSILKHLLTEGDRIILSSMSDSYDQGSYAIAMNVGGSASRMIFAPLEENGRLLFSKGHALVMVKKEVVVTNEVTTVVDDDNKGKSCSSSLETTKIRGKSNNETSHHHLQQQQQLASSLLQTYTDTTKLSLLFGSIAASIGPSYTPLILKILAGSQSSTSKRTISALSVYLLHLLPLSFNGSVEAFTSAAIRNDYDLAKFSLYHGVVGVIFYIVAPMMVNSWGTVGLIGAGGMAAMIRGIGNVRFAVDYFLDLGVLQQQKVVCRSTKTGDAMKGMMKLILPHPLVIFGFILSSIGTRWSMRQAWKMPFDNDNLNDESVASFPIEILNMATIIHVSIGIAFGFILLLLIWRYEYAFCERMIASVGSRRRQKIGKRTSLSSKDYSSSGNSGCVRKKVD